MNINRDYLIINDVKKSNIKLDNGSMFFYITDKNTQNIFVNLVINVSNNDLIQKYANIENAEDYTLTMNIVKPDNTYKVVEGKLHDKEKAIFEFNLKKDCCDVVGTYKCELLTKCNINDHEEITTSNKLTYKVKSSVLNDLDDIVEAPEYPIVIQLLDKLSDIEQYEEDRRANELARQLAEEQRQTRFNTLDADMVDRITTMDDKMVDVENRVSTKEQAVDKLITDTKKDINDYKVAKDTEIDEYKTAKDQQIDQAITNQNNKIDDAIANQNNKIDTATAEQNNRIEIVEASDNTQNTRLDALEAKDIAHETRITNIEAKNVEQDNRLDSIENVNQQQTSRLDSIEAINTTQNNRLDSIEAVNVTQDNRLDAIEIKNQQQDDRLLDVEKVNKRQDMDLKCLFAESKNNMIDVTEEGNSIYLQNSTVGYTLIDEIQGNTLVNCNKEADKEIILNGNINTEGYSNITLTEGIDGGLVDVALEGNTMVNVCDQKDPVAITKSYTVETGNHVALQGEYDGKCRPVVTGNTLVNLLDSNDFNFNSYYCTWDGFKINVNYDVIPNAGNIDFMTYKGNRLVEGNTYTAIINLSGTYSQGTYGGNTFGKALSELTQGINKVVFTYSSSMDICKCWVGGNSETIDYTLEYLLLLEGDYTNKPIPGYFEGLQSSFEDKVVTQEMVDNGEELAENLGKYKVDYVISREDGTVGFTKTFYLNSPLLEGDTIEQQGDNVVHVHRSELRAYETDDELTLPTDKTNTLVAKATPQYEVISQNDTILCDSYVNGHLDVDSVVPIEKVKFGYFAYQCKYLYTNTAYSIQFESDNVGKLDRIALGVNGVITNQDVVKGINKFNITTGSSVGYGYLDMYGIGFNASKIVVTEATDQDFGYFEGMKSVGECEDLEVVSCNSDGTLSNTQTLTREPLRAAGDIKDKYVLIDGKWYIERNCIEANLSDFDKSWKKDPEGVDFKKYYIENFAQAFIIDNLPRITDEQWSAYNTPGVYLNNRNKAVGIVIPKNLSISEYIGNSRIIYRPKYYTPTYEPIDYNPFEVYSDITHISNNSTIPCNMTIKNTGYNCLLKPSTTYTVSSNLGLNVVTTPNTLTEDCLRFYDTDTSTVTKMNNVTILEGDYTTGKPIPSHFAGIKSCFEQEYDEEVAKYKVKAKVVGKNEFSLVDAPWLNNGDMSIVDFDTNSITLKTSSNGNWQYARVKLNNITPNTAYKLSFSIEGNTNLFARVYNDTQPIDSTPEGDKNVRTFNSGNYKNLSIRFFISLGDSTITQSKYYNIQLEQGTEATPYEPYKENYIEFYINEPLRGIGDVKDKVYVKNDKVVVERNCGQREYQDGDFGTYLTDKVNTVYQLAEPAYEEVEYNDIQLFIESFKNSTLSYNSNVPVSSKLYYSYSVPLVDKVEQTANVTDQQDSMIIDLATQCAVMEMMLM